MNICWARFLVRFGVVMFEFHGKFRGATAVIVIVNISACLSIF